MLLSQITLDQLRAFLLWSGLLNYAVLLLSVVVWAFAGDAMLRLHARLIPVERARAQAAVYLMLGLYKLGIWLLFLIPWLTLLILFP